MSLSNFTKSTLEIHGETCYQYTADRKRGGPDWVFFNTVSDDETYDPTWPHAIGLDAALSSLQFISMLKGDDVKPTFTTELTGAQEDALETLYTNHVGPT